MNLERGSRKHLCTGRLRNLRGPPRLIRVEWIAGAILFLFFSRAPGALAQVDTMHAFYPLGKGNAWVYRDFSYFASEAADTISASILGDTTFQGRSYAVTHRLSHRYQSSALTFERIDSSGDVYRFDTYYGTPQLWYRLSDISRTVWQRGTMNVRFDSSTYRMVLGRRAHVLFVNFYSPVDSAFAHSTIQEQLAEGIGLIGALWPEGSSRSLLGAKINGISYPGEPPALISPADSAINVSASPMLRWIPTVGATYYVVQVSPYTSSFMTFVFDDTTSASSQVVGPLNYGTKYYWHVSAVSNGVRGAWSQARQFTVGQTSSVEPADNSIPAQFGLGQNYPNPFNPTTAISYRLSAVGLVTLKVFDVLGKEVSTLVNEIGQPGVYKVQWDGSGMPSGIYFYRLQAGDASTGSARGLLEAKKMILLR
ncbi:MAG: T9SS type A sorting domain-containing protein [Ignavibacteriales bacterium]|nr:T9SS type A sorting domain-containing protein [Ignavibacteriales bacterium]